MVQKSLDLKLARIHADPRGCKDFILADAKDADMALSIGAPGKSPESHPGEVRYRTLAEFRDIVTRIVEEKLVDIMLMSASTSEALTIEKRLFDNSPVTPAARANDTTDIHIIRGSRYPTDPSLPFRTATLDHIQCGRAECKPEERRLGADLGLYSITFNNDTALDRAALEEYKAVPPGGERKNFRHFLEVFDPNRPEAVEASQVPAFINDAIVRTLGGVTKAGRPIFLKMVYHGPQAMEELVHYDPHLVVGILGGGAGTTYDAFKLLSEAKKYGARVALFGRKINNAENQFAFIRFLRLIADGEVGAEEAVRAYHGVSATARRQAAAVARRRHEIADERDELRRQRQGRSASRRRPDAESGSEAGLRLRLQWQGDEGGETANGVVDFTKMTAAQKVAYHKARWDRILG